GTGCGSASWSLGPRGEPLEARLPSLFQPGPEVDARLPPRRAAALDRNLDQVILLAVEDVVDELGGRLAVGLEARGAEVLDDPQWRGGEVVHVALLEGLEEVVESPQSPPAVLVYHRGRDAFSGHVFARRLRRSQRKWVGGFGAER